MTAITFGRKLQSPLCEFGNGLVLSPLTGARTEKGTRERKLGPPRYCWSGTAGEAQFETIHEVRLKQFCVATRRLDAGSEAGRDLSQRTGGGRVVTVWLRPLVDEPLVRKQERMVGKLNRRQVICGRHNLDRINLTHRRSDMRIAV